MKHDTRLAWIQAVILGHAIADALGVPVEFQSRASLDRKPVRDYRGFGSHPVPAGTWSDDTSMSLAALDSLSHGLDYSDLMQRFCRWLNNAEYTATGTVFDIGIATTQALHRFLAGTEPLKCGGWGERDNGNGSLMRINPAVLYCRYTLGEVGSPESLSRIHEISALTHAHARSQIGCGIYAILLSSLLDSHRKSAVAAGLQKALQCYKGQKELAAYARLFDPQFAQTPREQIRSSGYVVDTLEAAVWCLLNTDNYPDAVLTAVNLGDDTDTVAAVTGGLAGALYGLRGIPASWISRLQAREDLLDLCNRFEASLPREGPAIQEQQESPCDFLFSAVSEDLPCESLDSFWLSEAAASNLMGYFLEKFYDPDLPQNRAAVANGARGQGFRWSEGRNYYSPEALSRICLAIGDLMLALKAGQEEDNAREALDYLRRCYLQQYPETPPEQVPCRTYFFPGNQLINFYRQVLEQLLRFLSRSGDRLLAVSCPGENDPEEVRNEDLIALKALFQQEPSGRYLIPFLDCLRNSMVFVPMQAILSSRDQQRLLDRIQAEGEDLEGREWSNLDQIRMKPDLLKAGDGTLMLPIFSNEEELRRFYGEEFSAIPVAARECVTMAHNTEGVEGLVLDAFSPVHAALPFQAADLLLMKD